MHSVFPGKKPLADELAQLEAHKGESRISSRGTVAHDVQGAIGRAAVKPFGVDPAQLPDLVQDERLGFLIDQIRGHLINLERVVR